MSNFTFVSFSPDVPSSSMFMLFCFFFSLFFFFCTVCAFHSPCHLVGLYLFIVICPVISIVTALLNSISMFHLILIFISASLLVLVLIALFISIIFCAFLCASIILLSTTLFLLRIHCCVSCLVIVFIRSVSFFFYVHFHFQVCLQFVTFIQIIINFCDSASSCVNFVLTAVWM